MHQLNIRKKMITLQLIAGLVALIGGAEILVRGASRIALAAGITPLVIGHTVVSFGTSSPELAIGVMSAVNGKPDIAMGNVVGSNIFNVLFILGLCAMIVPLTVAQQLIRLDVPIMIGASLLTLLFAWDGNIKFWEGLLLIGFGIYYVIFSIRQSKKESKKIKKEYDAELSNIKRPRMVGGILVSLLLVLVGLVLLIIGSRWLVNSAVAIASDFGVSDLVIGLTIVAAGTSMPEVATSLIASIKGEKDIAVGNAIGSNIFNIFFILGASALAAKGGIPVAVSALQFDIPIMTAVAVACLPIFFTGRRIDRWEGFVFLGYYIAYTIYLILANLKDAPIEAFSNAMIWFVMPITILTMIIITVRELRPTKKNL